MQLATDAQIGSLMQLSDAMNRLVNEYGTAAAIVIVRTQLKLLQGA